MRAGRSVSTRPPIGRTAARSNSAGTPSDASDKTSPAAGDIATRNSTSAANNAAGAGRGSARRPAPNNHASGATQFAS